MLDVDYDRAAIGGALERHLAHGGRYPSTLYGTGRAGERIAEQPQRGALELREAS